MKNFTWTHSQLISNICSMITLRGLEYILGFLMFPYLLRVLGPTSFGSIVFVQSVIQYFNIVIDYGFNITAPKCIAKSSFDDLAINFSTFFVAKIILWIIVTLLSVVFYSILKKIFFIQLDYKLFAVTYISVIGNVIFPIWFFQGIQKMKYIAILNIIGRVFGVIGIFIFVHTEKDYIIAALFLSCTPLLSGLGALYIISKNYSTLWCRPSIGELYARYKEGGYIFLSTLASNLYTNGNIIILGTITNSTIVGYYSGASKLIDCIRSLISAISQAIYPYICNLVQINYQQAILFLKKLLRKTFYMGIIIALIILFGSQYIIPIILGSSYTDSIVIFKAMAFIPCVVAVSTVFGGLTMLPLEMQSTYSYILIGAAILSLALAVPMTIYYGAIGTAMTVMITESVIMFSMGIIILEKHILSDD